MRSVNIEKRNDKRNSTDYSFSKTLIRLYALYLFLLFFIYTL